MFNMDFTIWFDQAQINSVDGKNFEKWNKKIMMFLNTYYETAR